MSINRLRRERLQRGTHVLPFLDSVKEHYNNNSAPVIGRAVLKYLFSY